MISKPAILSSSRSRRRSAEVELYNYVEQEISIKTPTVIATEIEGV